jgi:hypothetical protein
VSYPTGRKRTNMPERSCYHCGRVMLACCLPKHERTHRLPYERLLPDADEQGAIVKRYGRGDTLETIAADTFWSKSEVRRVLVLNGVIMRKPGRYGPKISRDEVLERIRLYESGLSLTEVAVARGVTHEAIRATLKREGVPLRRKGGNGAGRENLRRGRQLRLERLAAARESS